MRIASNAKDVDENSRIPQTVNGLGISNLN